LSDGLYDFNFPGWSINVNVPYFVSNGYLVFLPDIIYKIGEPGQSALNAVESAARYLSRMPWVDSTRMAIQGHSFGGYETNYIVTHSHLFAAAATFAGTSDWISAYGELEFGSGLPRQSKYEIGQDRLGASLWQRPDLYVKNSPIFSADQVTTPLLIVANKEDGGVPFEQGVELYMALRRLNKKVWMLQYDGEGHSVSGKNAADYTIRLTQFFDHYLKGAAPPVWMTQGIPASLKGIKAGYELDNSGTQP